MGSETKKIESFVSVVAALDSCDQIVEKYIEDITAMLSSNYTNYEVVLIDNRSIDATVSKVEALLSCTPNLRLIQLSQKNDLDTLFTAGIQTAIGDFVVLTQPVCDPVDEIPAMIAESRQGTDIIMGVSNYKPNIGYRVMRSLFRVFFGKMVDYNVPSNYTGLTVISRRAVNALTNYNFRSRSLFVRMTQIGFSYSPYKYTAPKNSATKSRDVLSGIQQATKLLVFNSFAPLRIISMVGFFGSFCSLMASVYAVIIRLFKNDVIEGWTTMMLLISGLFTIMFVIMAFQSEYMSRLLEEQYQRSEFFVVSEKHSSVMVDTSRLNVFEDSTTGEVNAVQTGRDK